MIYALIFIIGFLIGYYFKYPKDTKKEYKSFSIYMCSPPTKPMKNRIPPKGGSGAMISKKMQSRPNPPQLIYKNQY